MKTNTIKQLSSFLVQDVHGRDCISYAYDEINGSTGETESHGNRGSFYVVDEKVSEAIGTVRDYIRSMKLS